MRFTSDEAKDVRCPLRVDGLYCIGKACAAWRWAEDEHVTGYCGMAGRIEALMHGLTNRKFA